MKGELIILIAVCSFATSMVPRDRRAVATDEMVPSTDKSKEICAPSTPCAWSIYKPVIKLIEINITNSYCVCPPDTVCIIKEDDLTANAYVHRCRSPGDDEITES